MRVMKDLVADGNSVLLVDHDAHILTKADWLIEMGPMAGEEGGQVIAQGSIPEICRNPASVIGPFLSGKRTVRMKKKNQPSHLFQNGAIYLETGAIHTVKPLKVSIPKGKLTVVTGVSGSGKTTLILESLVPGLEAYIQGKTLGYLTLGEETPSLSGGEAQRLKLAGELGKGQADTVFVFDEPTIGLHPLDVQTLLDVFSTLIDSGATVVVIEHDLDVIRNADYVIDMGPGGGKAGGRIVAAGNPGEIKGKAESATGKFL